MVFDIPDKSTPLREQHEMEIAELRMELKKSQEREAKSVAIELDLREQLHRKDQAIKGLVHAIQELSA